MGNGIMICGLNGVGKSTVGRALAKEIGYHFIDNENLYFSRTAESEPYANSKPREEVEQLLMDEVNAHENFVFVAVKGDYGEAIIPLYQYVVLIEVPKDIRTQRVRNRSFMKFGNRILAGGDLHEQEEAFFQMIEARPEDYVENWVRDLNCPVIRIDGTKSISENIRFIIEQMNR